MYIALSPGALGVQANTLADAIQVAKAAGYSGVEVNIHEIADLIDERGVDNTRQLFTDAGLKPAGWGLPVDWRGDEAALQTGLTALPRLARAAQSIGCERTSTWILSSSDERNAEENRQFHIARLKPVADILAQHGCRLGLEFLGPKHIRMAGKYPFIYKMHDMLRLAAEIGHNVGLLLDCWHWYTSGGTLGELLSLHNEDIVYVHVADAPIGIALDDQVDSRRCLPGTTDVIDLVGFLQALRKIGYDGPVVPEPFGNPATWAADALKSTWKKAML